MNKTPLGQLFDSSVLTLGGGGIGQVWGDTSRDEAVATVRAAVDAGINFFDMAPMYGDGEAERVMGEAFAGGYPQGVHVSTKCMLGDVAAEQVLPRLSASLDESCARMGLSYIDVFLLHGFVVPDGWSGELPRDLQKRITVPWTSYVEHVVPAFQSLQQQGRIGAFGVTAASLQESNLAVLAAADKPAVVQCITNVLDSPGNMAIATPRNGEIPQPRQVIATAAQQGVGVMGIRAVAAGALTDTIDRPVHDKSREAADYRLAQSFRDEAARRGVSTALLAHQYALSMPGVDTVVLGVKNRTELAECVQAAALPRLDAGTLEALQINA